MTPNPARPSRLLKRRLLKAPELARVEPLRRHGAEFLHRTDADLEVLVDLSAVEVRGHAGELQLAVQRFVRHAEERPVGHAEAEAVGGDRRRLHVESDGARLRETLHRLAMIAELPVAVVDGS